MFHNWRFSWPSGCRGRLARANTRASAPFWGASSAVRPTPPRQIYAQAGTDAARLHSLGIPNAFGADHRLAGDGSPTSSGLKTGDTAEGNFAPLECGAMPRPLVRSEIRRPDGRRSAGQLIPANSACRRQPDADLWPAVCRSRWHSSRRLLVGKRVEGIHPRECARIQNPFGA